MKKTIAGMATALLAFGGMAFAGLGPGTGTAQADHACTPSGVCNRLWCPGQALPNKNSTAKPYAASEITWDWSVCHWIFNDDYDRYGGVWVAPGLKEGEPVGF